MTETSSGTYSEFSEISDLRSVHELLRRRMVLAMVSLTDCHSIMEKLDPEQILYVLENIQAELIDTAEEVMARVTIEAPDQYLILYGYPDQHHDEALRCITHISRLMFRFKEMQKDIHQQGLEMPQLAITAHVGDVLVGPVSTKESDTFQVLGSEMTLLRHVAKYTPPSECHVTEPLMEDVLREVPPNWYHYSCDEEASPWSSTFDLTEDLFEEEDSEGQANNNSPEPNEGFEHQLRDQLQRKVISIGVEPGDGELPGDPEFVFRSYHKAQPKGFEQGVEVFELSRPAQYVPSFNFDPRIASEVGADRLFGKYRLNRLLGRGGMGEVWQGVDSFGNSVAVKMLLAGSMASERQLKRFRREAEIMAQLNHRNICRIYEVGEVGRITYIAMEYVDGVSLSEILNATDDEMAAFEKSQNFMKFAKASGSDTDVGGLVRHLLDQRTIDPDAEEGSQQQLDDITYLKRKKIKSGHRYQILPLQQSLMMVSSLCEAVQFAHENGIYHRDLKPANLMLRSDGEPVVMDFGLAKLTDSQAEHSISVTDQIMGTIDYMAPEQAISAKDIDERADVYSIGAILYQLVTGEKHFKATGNLIFDAQRLQEHTPKRPRQLNPRLDVDMELVILKSLRAEPDQRYRSVSAFLEDVLRYRRGEIIFARDITLREILIRNFKRNKLISIIATSAAVLILSLMIGSYVIVVQEESKNYRANQRLRKSVSEISSLRRQLGLATREAANQSNRTAAIRRFMYDIFTGAGEKQGDWREWQLHEVLRTAGQNIVSMYEDDPILQADFHDTLGEVYLKHSEWPLAKKHYEESYRLRSEMLGPLDPESIQSAEGLVVSLTELGNYKQALEMQRGIYDVHQKELGAEHPRSVFAAYQLAMILIRSEDFVSGEKILRQLLRSETEISYQISLDDIREAFGATVHGPEQISKTKLDVKAILEKLESDHEVEQERVLSLRHNLAILHLLDGDEIQAQQMMQKVYEDRVVLLGQDHIDTLATLNDLAVLSENLGQYQKAKALYAEVQMKMEAKFGPLHVMSILVRLRLARMIAREENLDQGLVMLEQVIQDCKAELGESHHLTQDAWYERLALLTQYRPQADLGEQLNDIYILRKNSLGENHPRSLRVLNTLVQLYIQLRQYKQARDLLNDLYPRVIQQLGPYHQQSMEIHLLLAVTLQRLLAYQDSLSVYRELMKNQTKVLGKHHPQSIATRQAYVHLLIDAGEYDEAYLTLKSIQSDLATSEIAMVPNATVYELKRLQSQLAMRLGETRPALQMAQSILKDAKSTEDEEINLDWASAFYAKMLREAGLLQQAMSTLNEPSVVMNVAVAQEQLMIALEQGQGESILKAEKQWRDALRETFRGQDHLNSIRIMRMTAIRDAATGEWAKAIQTLEDAILLMNPELALTEWRSMLVKDLMVMYVRTQQYEKLTALWKDHEAAINIMLTDRYERQVMRLMVLYADSKSKNRLSEDLKDHMIQMLSNQEEWLLRDFTTMLILAELFEKDQKLQEFMPLFNKHVAWMLERYSDQHWRTAASRAVWARLLKNADRSKEAMTHDQAVNHARAQWGEAHVVAQWLKYLVKGP